MPHGAIIDFEQASRPYMQCSAYDATPPASTIGFNHEIEVARRA